MIFLLPPSETKEPGGKKISKVLSFKELDPARKVIQSALLELCSKPNVAAKALKLGPKQLGEIAVNLELAKPRCLPALDRYTGTLYDALIDGGVDAAMRARSGKIVFIQSSLFGLVSAADLIPNYRLSAGSKLPGVSLKTLWQAAHEPVWSRFAGEIVVDMRSNSYSDLAPVPESLNFLTLDVVMEDRKGNRIRLNHFNKKAKGQFVRAALSSKTEPKKVTDLKEIAKRANLELEISGNQLLLITHG